MVAGRLLATQTVKARSLIDGASYGPDALKAIGRAFDEAWAQIAGNFGSDPVVIEAARIKLANALLSVADDDSSRAAEDGARLPDAEGHRQVMVGRGLEARGPASTL